MEYHLAQVNIAKMIADLDDPIMSGFVNRLDEINSLADSSSGFVWWFKSDNGDATYLRPYADKNILFNMSVWESIDALKTSVYKSNHLELLRSKKDWFLNINKPHMALWRIPKDYIPNVDEALEKLDLIKDIGASEQAFTFSKPYPPNKFATSDVPNVATPISKTC